MICCVPVGKAEVEMTRITDARDQLLLLALRLVAFVGEHLLLFLALAVLLYMG